MNDRINDLALCKSGAILMDLIMPDTENPDRINWNINCTKEHLINFADIIIHECIKVVDSMADPNDSELYFWAIENCSEKIKKHFYE